jgi:hypothetical protein
MKIVAFCAPEPGYRILQYMFFLENAGSISAYNEFGSATPSDEQNTADLTATSVRTPHFVLFFYKHPSCNTTAAQAEAEMEWPNPLRMKTRRLRLVMPCCRYTCLFSHARVA